MPRKRVLPSLPAGPRKIGPVTLPGVRPLSLPSAPRRAVTPPTPGRRVGPNLTPGVPRKVGPVALPAKPARRSRPRRKK
jgi:hypothetical protein